MSGVTPDPATGQSAGDTAPDTNTTPPTMFTQEQVNSVGAREKREGRKALQTELETLTGYTIDELKALKKQATQPAPASAPATPAPTQGKDDVLELVRQMAEKQEALEAKLTQAEEKTARDALIAKAKAGGVWEQFMDKVTSEEAIQATLDAQKTILEQHGAGAKKPAPTTFGGASSTSVRDVATNDEMSLEDAQKRLKDLGGI